MNTEAPSNRSFGWTFTTVFALIGGYSLWHQGAFYPWAFALAATTAAVTLFASDWLSGPNRAWMRFGELLHRIVSPIVLGIVFYGVFTPFACVMRMAGRDILHRRFEPEAKTYWVDRSPPGPAADSFENQF